VNGGRKPVGCGEYAQFSLTGCSISRKQLSTVRQTAFISNPNEVGNIAPNSANVAVNGTANVVNRNAGEDGWRDNQPPKLKLHHRGKNHKSLSGLLVGGEVTAVTLAGVIVRRFGNRAARVLPRLTAVVPMET
jgi:hypothetical protein